MTSTPKFNTPFPGGNAVRVSAQITTEWNGFHFYATIHRDDDAGSPEDNIDGFWPSLDRTAPGWIGDNPAESYEVQKAECEAVMARYRAGKMIYCGVAVYVCKGGHVLTGPYENALWGVDINWPHGDNAYLVDVANELLPEALAQARKAIEAKVASAQATIAALTA